MTTPHERALEAFTEYFVRNYPGPDTVIFDPKWHAPKLFNAAMKAIEASGGVVCSKEPVAWKIPGSVAVTTDKDIVERWHQQPNPLVPDQHNIRHQQ